MKIAIGQFTPPMAVNLMVSCRIAGVSMESTSPWVIWMIFAMFISLALVVVLTIVERHTIVPVLSRTASVASAQRVRLTTLMALVELRL